MNKKQKNILIGGLLALVLIMAIGYAAFATQLNIGGTAETTTTWNIRITNIRTVDLTSINGAALANNGAYDVQAPTYDNTNGLTATFSTGLTSPGDTRVYEVEVSNLGSIDADITKVLTNNSNNPAIEFTYDGVSSTSVLTNAGAYTKSSLLTTEPFSLPATTGNVKYVYVTVKYSESVQGQPTSTTGSMTLTLNAVQEENSSSGGDTPPPSSNVYYVYDEAGHSIGGAFDTTGLTPETIPSGKNFFLKYVLDGTTISEAWTCQTFGILSEPVCIRGGTENGENPSNVYGNSTIGNWKILKDLDDNNNSFTGSCSFESVKSYCIFGDLDLTATPYGGVSAYDDDTGASCGISYGGSAICGE